MGREQYEVQFERVTKKFGEKTVLNEVNFQVAGARPFAFSGGAALARVSP